MKRTFFLSLAAAAAVAVFAPEPAEARVYDITDAETKAYCRANPTHCKRSIAWGPTLGMWIGVPAVLGILRGVFSGGE